MYRILFVLWATLTVYGRAEDKQSSLPFPLKPLHVFAPDYNSVKNPECRTQSQAFLRDLKDLKLWAVKMYDASGKISSGVLSGNVQWLGDDRECFSVSSKSDATEDDPDNIRGQYCAVRIFAEPTNQSGSSQNDLPEIFDLIHTHKALQNSPEDRIVIFPSFSPLTLGLCVPRSCSYEDVEAALTEWISPLNSSGVEVQLLVRPDSCSKEGHDKWARNTYLILGFCAFMTLVSIAGAVYERRKEMKMMKNDIKEEEEGKLMRVFLAFSFRSNMRILLDTETHVDEIGCLHGIRVFFSIFLYLLHKSFLGLQGSISNRSDVAFFMDGPKSMVLRSFWSHVDTFVILSGLLTSYYSVKRLQEGRKLNILKMYFQRYIKFTPLYFVCVLFAGNVMEYLISDAQYTRLIQIFTTNCKEAWLNTITYTNNLRGFEDMCYQPAHQLETDMQMYLLSPFLILILWKMRILGILSFTTLLALLSAYKYHVVIKEDLSTVLYYGTEIHRLIRSANYLYLNFLQRLVPYLCGILLGYFLRIRNKNFKFSKFGIIIGSATAMWGAYYSFYSMVHVSRPGYVSNTEEFAVFGTLQPLMWSFALCWFILLCVIGQAEWINRKLKWKGFQVTSRLTFAFYLVQIPVMLVEVGRNSNPFIFSLISIFDLNIFTISVLLSIWLTLLFLLPIGTLWRIFSKESTTHNKVIKEE